MAVDEDGLLPAKRARSRVRVSTRSNERVRLPKNLPENIELHNEKRERAWVFKKGRSRSTMTGSKTNTNYVTANNGVTVRIIDHSNGRREARLPLLYYNTKRVRNEQGQANKRAKQVPAAVVVNFLKRLNVNSVSLDDESYILLPSGGKIYRIVLPGTYDVYPGFHHLNEANKRLVAARDIASKVLEKNDGKNVNSKLQLVYETLKKQDLLRRHSVRREYRRGV